MEEDVKTHARQTGIWNGVYALLRKRVPRRRNDDGRALPRAFLCAQTGCPDASSKVFYSARRRSLANTPLRRSMPKRRVK